MPRKPRIITETVKKLYALADRVETFSGPDTVGQLGSALRDIADALDKYDARETRLDPSKRRKAKKGAKR